MTEAEDTLLHTLGLGRRTGDAWRNHFVGSTPEIVELVAAGLMEKVNNGSPLSGGDPVFRATAAGCRDSHGGNDSSRRGEAGNGFHLPWSGAWIGRKGTRTSYGTSVVDRSPFGPRPHEYARASARAAATRFVATRGTTQNDGTAHDYDSAPTVMPSESGKQIV
jgi:hypothetical protein